MSRLVRGIKNAVIPKGIIPELMMLGTLEIQDVPMDDGILLRSSIITYEGKDYVMKQEYVGRWFDER